MTPSKDSELRISQPKVLKWKVFQSTQIPKTKCSLIKDKLTLLALPKLRVTCTCRTLKETFAHTFHFSQAQIIQLCFQLPTRLIRIIMLMIRICVFSITTRRTNEEIQCFMVPKFAPTHPSPKSRLYHSTMMPLVVNWHIIWWNCSITQDATRPNFVKNTPPSANLEPFALLLTR